MNVKELRSLLNEYDDDDAVCFETKDNLIEITDVAKCGRNKYTRISQMSSKQTKPVCLLSSFSYFNLTRTIT